MRGKAGKAGFGAGRMGDVGKESGESREGVRKESRKCREGVREESGNDPGRVGKESESERG